MNLGTGVARTGGEASGNQFEKLGLVVEAEDFPGFDNIVPTIDIERAELVALLDVGATLIT